MRQALDDSAETPRFVETLPRRGYGFIYPVQDSPVNDSQPVRETGWRSITLLALLAAGAVAAVVLKLNSPGVADPARDHQPPRTRVAVLPLENLTGGAEQNYLVDVLGAEIADVRSRRNTVPRASGRFRHDRRRGDPTHDAAEREADLLKRAILVSVPCRAFFQIVTPASCACPPKPAGAGDQAPGRPRTGEMGRSEPCRAA